MKAIITLTSALGVVLGCAASVPNEEEIRSASITLERKGYCYPWFACPWYTLTLYGTGEVKYQGDDRTVFDSIERDTIDPKAFRHIFFELWNNQFLKLDSEYVNPPGYSVTHVPTRVTMLRVGHVVKRVSNRAGGPPFLTAVEYQIDSVARSVRWVGTFDDRLTVVFARAKSQRLDSLEMLKHQVDSTYDYEETHGTYAVRTRLRDSLKTIYRNLSKNALDSLSSTSYQGGSVSSSVTRTLH